MNQFHRTAGNILFGLNALLLFFLLFGDRMEFPAWIQAVGRIHPLLLHLPIGAVIIVVVLLFFRNRFADVTMGLLALAAATAAVTAIMGVVLSMEGGYNEDTLNAHKLSGALLSFILAGAYFVSSNRKLVNITTGISFMLVLIAGHYGSILTHGDDFVFEPLLSKKQNTKIISDSTSLFAAAIQPLFDEKCTGCHNEKKSKGGLVLSTLAGIAKGGEDGEVWRGGNPHGSLVIKRILLPEDHEDHMPPKGKAQLTASEVQLLFQWIISGADTAKAWTTYHPSDSVRKLAEQLIRSAAHTSADVHYTFEPASSETIEKLNDPYRTVALIALNEPALAATFFIRNEFKPAKLEELMAVKEQLVSLNLSKMPVTDADCDVIGKFRNLEKLNLNFSSITIKGLQALSSLPELRSLSVAGTTLDGKAMSTLKDFKKLKEIFVWNTPASADITRLEKDLPALAWNTGFAPDANERLRLTPPIPVTDKTLLDEGEQIYLTHKLPETVIRYTIDGSDPDSTSNLMYDAPFNIDGYTILKTMACKEGWFCSKVGTYVLYKKGVAPLETKLFTVPNKDYKGEGAATLSNNKKGFTDDHHDIAWIGFKENPLSAEFKFAPGTNISKITLSYDLSTGGWLFPPAKMEIWGGKDESSLKLIKQLKPEQPSKMESTRNAALVIPVEGNYETWKVVAWPVAELPKWHPSNNPKTKDKRAWLFVDEIIFNN
ncbi:MAG TPA: c-type cytochrome domain-containing protein [Cyclobacteriaceae bacterium]|nr:c-type cytochrome domain-containing protein [Cyclobacteriaceae bacterium]